MTLGQYALIALALACVAMAAWPYYLVLRHGEPSDGLTTAPSKETSQ